MSKPDRWWVRELISVCDPISLDPIRTLRHPPFELRADPAAAHNSPDSDWYDGQLLASYLVYTGNFTHPMSRRELTRAECAALDAYLKENRLCVAKVAAAFDIRDDYKKPGGAPGSRLHDMRTEADAVVGPLRHAVAGPERALRCVLGDEPAGLGDRVGELGHAVSWGAEVVEVAHPKIVLSS
jgi:hypothetical protein